MLNIGQIVDEISSWSGGHFGGNVTSQRAANRAILQEDPRGIKSLEGLLV